MSKRITKLTSVQTQEVSLVRRGANNKRFALTKSKEIDMSFHELLKSVLETEAEGEGQLIELLKAAEADEDAIQCAVANYRLQNGFRDKLSKEAFAEVVKAAGYEMDKAKTPPDKDKDKSKDDNKKPFPGAKPPFKAEKSDMSPEMERVFKEQQTEIEALRKAHEGTLELLEKERKEKVRKEYIAKCANDYAFVPGMSAEEMGEMLQKAYETSEDFGKKLEKQWEQTNEAVSKSQLLVNQGIVPQNNGQCDTAWTKMQKLAEQKIQKAEGGLSEAKALDQVMKEHPELYQEYLNENPSQTGDSE